MYIIEPTHPWWSDREVPGEPMAPDTEFSSNGNKRWLSGEELLEMIGEEIDG